MSQQSDPVLEIELPISAGQSLVMSSTEKTVKEMAAERETLRKQIAELQGRFCAMEAADKNLTTQRDQMSAELTLTKRERDEFQKAVHFLTQREFAFTYEDIAEAQKNGLTFDQVIGKLEKMVQWI